MKVHLAGNEYGICYRCADCGAVLMPERYADTPHSLRHPTHESGWFSDSTKKSSCQFSGTIWKRPTLELEPA